jgi:hypothetical protein
MLLVRFDGYAKGSFPPQCPPSTRNIVASSIFAQSFKRGFPPGENFGLKSGLKILRVRGDPTEVSRLRGRRDGSQPKMRKSRFIRAYSQANRIYCSSARHYSCSGRSRWVKDYVPSHSRVVRIQLCFCFKGRSGGAEQHQTSRNFG